MVEQEPYFDCLCVTDFENHKIKRIALPLSILSQVAQDLRCYQLQTGRTQSFQINIINPDGSQEWIEAFDIAVPYKVGLYLEKLAMEVNDRS